jgi:hypothetical protein
MVEGSKMTREEAIAKAMKLLKLAESSNVHEAALAAQRAQEILARFGIEQAVIDAEASGPGENKETVGMESEPLEKLGRKVSSWKSYLANVISQANGCRVYTKTFGGGVTLVIVGRASDAQIVRYLYPSLVREVDRLTKREGAGMGRTWCNNFRIGVVDAIKEKLFEAKRRTEEAMRSEAVNPHALVKVDQAIAKRDGLNAEIEAFMKAKYKVQAEKRASFRGDAEAREAGREVGRELNINGNARGGLEAGRARMEG